MPNIKILADSSCDLTDEQLSDAQVTLVPLTVIAGHKQFTDRVDIDGPQLAQMIEKDKSLRVGTSQPNFTQFKEAFQNCSEYDEVICITMSSNGSGTHDSAVIAAKEFAGEKPKVHIFDSLSASIGVGYFVLLADKFRAAGNTALQILEELKQKRDKLGSYFYADTLEFLKRGGRVNTVTAGVGALLGIKPIIGVIDGFGRNVAKHKGETAAIKALARTYFEKHDGEDIYITHSNNAAGVDLLLQEIKTLGCKVNAIINPMGCVLTTHAGPRSIGVFFPQKEGNVWPLPSPALHDVIPAASHIIEQKLEQTIEKVKEKIKK